MPRVSPHIECKNEEGKNQSATEIQLVRRGEISDITLILMILSNVEGMVISVRPREMGSEYVSDCAQSVEW